MKMTQSLQRTAGGRAPGVSIGAGVALTLALLTSSPVGAVEAVWNQPGGGVWFNQDNWLGGVPRAPGDTALFDVAAPGGDAIIDLKLIARITTLTDRNPNAITLRGRSLIQLDDPDDSGPVRIDHATGAGPMTIDLPLNVVNDDLVVRVEDADGRLTIDEFLGNGTIQLTKEGAGRLALGGDSQPGRDNWKGPITISAGTLFALTDNALGSSSDDDSEATSVLPGAMLAIARSTTVAGERILIDSGRLAGDTGGISTVGGPVELLSDSTFTNLGEGGWLLLNGPVRGPASVLIDRGVVDFHGPMEFTGQLRVAGGEAHVSAPARHSGNLVDADGRLFVPESGSLVEAGPTTVRAGGELRVVKPAGTDPAAHSVLPGSVRLDGGQLTLAENDISFAGFLDTASTGGVIVLENQPDYTAGGTNLIDFEAIGPNLRLGGADTRTAIASTVVMRPDTATRTLRFGGGGRILTIKAPITDIDGQPTHVDQGLDGVTILEGVNTYSGTTIVHDGMLVVESGSSLGSPSAGTRIDPDGVLVLESGAVVDQEPITLNGGTLAGGPRPASSEDAPIEVAADSTIGIAGSGYNIFIASAISGPGGLTFQGARATLQGNNTYAGPTIIASGSTQVESPTGLGSPDQGTVVGSGGSLSLLALVDEPLEVRGGWLLFGPDAAAYSKPVTLAGGRITLAPDVTQATPFVLVSGETRITGRYGVMAGGTTGEGDIVLSDSDEIVVEGAPLAHEGNLTIRDNRVILNTPNTYTGTTTIAHRGDAVVNHPDALGSSTTPVRIERNGRVTLNELPARDFEILEGTLTIADTGQPFPGTVKLLGRAGLAGAAFLTVEGEFDNPLVAEGMKNAISGGTFNGVISGFGRLGVGGPSRVAGGNTFEGMIVTGGRSVNVDHPNGLGSPELGTRVQGTLNINVALSEPILVENQGNVNLYAQIDRFPVRGIEDPVRGDTRVSIRTPSVYDERVDLDHMVLFVGSDTQLAGLTLRNGSRLIIGTNAELQIPDEEFVIQSGTLNGTPAGVAVIRKTTMEMALIDGVTDFSGELVVEKGFTVIRNSFAAAEGRLTIESPRDAALIVVAGDVIPASVRLNDAEGIDGHGALLVRSRTNSSAAVRLTGSLDLGPNGSRIGSLSPGQTFMRIDGPISGGSLTKMAEDLFLTVTNGANTYTGTTDVRGGNLTVEGEGRITESSGIVIRQGAQLRISNSEEANLGDRIADSIPVDLRGGTLSLQGPVTTPGTPVMGQMAEQIGLVTAREGHSSLKSFGGSPADQQTARLTIGSLDRAPGATLQLEVAPTHPIDAVTPPELYNGIVGGWATVRNHLNSSTRVTGLATYGENGFMPLDTFVTDIATAGPDDNVLLIADAVSALADDATVNSLTGDRRALQPLDLGGFELNVVSGGLFSRRKLINGRVTAGLDGPAELFVHEGIFLGADVVDNPSGPVTVVFPQGGVVAGNNSYTGATVVNGGTLKIVAESALPEGTDLAIHDGTVEIGFGRGAVHNFGALTIDGGGALIKRGNQDRVSFDSIELRDGRLQGLLSGEGPLTKTTDATVILEALGTDFRGPVDIREGRLGIRSDPFGTGEVTVSGGTLFSYSGEATISNPLTLSGGEINMGRIKITGPLTVSGPSRLSMDDNGEITGTISGTGSLTINGVAHSVSGGDGPLQVDPFTRRLRITGDNSDFSGAVDLASGYVRIEHGNSLGTGPVTIGPGARLQLAAPVAPDGAIEMTNAVTLDGGQLLAQSVDRVTGSNRLLGDLTVRSDSFLGVQPDAPLEITGAVRFGDDVRLTLLDE
ncbi:MAG: autotransporter-associated beta strand repeat-containing protein, partial [Pirellulales bacterium]